MKAKERNIKGRNIVAQEKDIIRKSFSLTSIKPCREKEIRTRRARAKKRT